MFNEVLISEKMYYFFGLFSTAGPEVSLYMKYLNFIRMNSL